MYTTLRLRTRRLRGWHVLAAIVGCGLVLGVGLALALGPRELLRQVRSMPTRAADAGRAAKFLLTPAQPEPTAPAGAAFPLTLRRAPASGPLRVSPTNPRYFAAANGHAVYLTGSHTWANLQDMGGANPPPLFDYTAYLDFLERHNHNFFRLWRWEQTRWTVEIATEQYWFAPMPYQRTGPGLALDGLPKFDLTKFNQAYFDRMRARVIAAGQRGIYVSVMLFDGWSVAKAKGEYSLNNPWKGHPMNAANNINGIDGDPNGDNSGTETHELVAPAVTTLQEAYVRKVIDTVGDLDNVLYEISNESDGSARDWQYHLIALIRSYEAGKPKQHPIGMTSMWPGGYTPDLYNSDAEWISTNNDGDVLANPPAADGRKVLLTDSDHLCGVCLDRQWVWKTFLRGHNVLFMDVYDTIGFGVGGGNLDPNNPAWESARRSMGYTLTYANRMRLDHALPRGDLASSGYCLADLSAGGEAYLAYLPDGGAVTVDLADVAGALAVEWLNPASGLVTPMPLVSGGGNHTFTAPFVGDAVLFIYRAPLAEVRLPMVAR